MVKRELSPAKKAQTQKWVQIQEPIWANIRLGKKIRQREATVCSKYFRMSHGAIEDVRKHSEGKKKQRIV